MNRCFGASVIKAIILAFAGSVGAFAQVTVTWTGLGYDSGTDVEENWLGNQLPLNDGTEEFIFGPAVRQDPIFYDDIDARKVSLVGHNRPYFLDDDYGALTIGSGGLTYAPASPVYSQIGAYPVVVPVNQTWDIQSGTLAVEYTIEGAGQITKTGNGTLVISESYNESWTGGLVLSAGTLGLGPGASMALGTGTLVFAGGTVRASDSYSYYGEESDEEVRVGSPVVSNGLIKTKNQTSLAFEEAVTLAANTTLQSEGENLFFEGGIGETGGARKLTVDANNAVILTGTSGWTGGTDVTKGVVIFGGEDNTPGIAGSILVRADGYVGIGVANNVAGFLSEIAPASTGAIGFDSNLEESLDHFTSPINLAGLSDAVRLGTATGAVLDPAAVITPYGSTYRFGGGGGTLAVASQLTGARNLDVTSPAAVPLTVRLLNTTNDFSGSVNVSNSALVFADNTPLPGGTYTMDRGSYIGTEDPDVTPAGFLPHFSAGTQGIIGFDIGPGASTTREVSNLSLAAFSGGVYVGTASALIDEYGEVTGPGLRLTGTLTPGSDGNFRFAGYKGGALEVASVLSGPAAQVYIGEPNTLGTMGDPRREEYSTVLLSGDNTFGGTTTLYAGRLLLGHANALGTGALVVQPHNITVPGRDSDDPILAELGAWPESLTVTNAVQLNAGLSIGDTEPLELAGMISGDHGLELAEDAELRLSHDNTFSGGVYLRPYSALTIAANQATGLGQLGFGGGYGANVYVDTNAPVIHGLNSREDGDYAYFHLMENATVLTIDQPEGLDSKFVGQMHSDYYSESESSNGTARFVKDGAGTLRIYGELDFYGIADPTRDAAISAEVRAGRLIVSGDSGGEESYSYSSESDYTRLGYDAVLLKGGTLAVTNGATLGNTIIAESGTLAGHGTFSTHAVIGSQVTVAPGLDGESPIGHLRFDELTLAAGGTLAWNLRDATAAGALGWDQIEIVSDDTLIVTATAETPFSIKLITLQSNGTPGAAANFDPTQPYSWMLIESYSTEDFDAAKFFVNADQFANSLAIDGKDGSFNVSLGGEYGSSLMLNFVPVPEPSTWALLGLGLGFLAWSAWRRRRA